MNETQNPQHPQIPQHPLTPPARHRREGARPDYRLALGLGALTLLYPILNITINLLGFEGAAPVPVNAWLWLVIGLVWVLVGWLTRTPQPVLTLLATGIAGGLLTSALVIGIQLFTSGGPGLATAPFAIASILALHAAGGVICGLIAWGLQAGTRPHMTGHDRG
jgi:hypothetical protein